MSHALHSRPERGGYGQGGPGGRRVVMAFHDPLLNGATISALRAVPFLEERGWTFSFWTPAPGPCFTWLAEGGADVRGEFRPLASSFQSLKLPPGLGPRLARTPGYLYRFGAMLREVRPELMHANSLFTFPEALTAEHVLRVPTLSHVHDMAPAGKLREARAICRHGVSKSIAVSRACAASYAHDDWAPDVVYEAAPLPSAMNHVREDPIPFVVGTIGVVAKRKGSDLFVNAARELLARHPGRFEFRLVGSPNDPFDREWGESVIAEAKAAGIVYKPETDVFAELRTWDCFTLPSRADPCPIVMLEAMASGLPVVGARADGIVEQVTPECGVLVRADDARALAVGIESVATMSSADREQMGKAGRDRVASTFSLEAQAKALDESYHATLDVSARSRRVGSRRASRP